MVLDVMPKTFNRANTCVSGASWKIFQCRYPTKTFEEFWEFCCQYYSLHSYPLHFLMTMNDTSKVACLELGACDTTEVKEEPYEEKDTNYCFVYYMARNYGGRYLDGCCVELLFS
jgi:hypothetical protein